MSGDLISLRMLLVAASTPDGDYWRQGAGLASVPIEFLTAEPGEAASRLPANLDVVVLDQSVPASNKENLAKAVRAAQPKCLIVNSTPGAATALPGADGTVGRPMNAPDAQDLIERCVRAKLPTRILIVDDSPTMRSIVRKILSASRFSLEMFEAAEGIAALAQLRSGNFGVVILDYNMPGLNGIETLAEIKRESPQVAVVMMTSTVDDAVADRARASGALGFLKKPFYPADIDSLLMRHFGLRALG